MAKLCETRNYEKDITSQNFWYSQFVYLQFSVANSSSLSSSIRFLYKLNPQQFVSLPCLMFMVVYVITSGKICSVKYWTGSCWIFCKKFHYNYLFKHSINDIEVQPVYNHPFWLNFNYSCIIRFFKRSWLVKA